MDAPVKVACVQVEPVILERDATIEKIASVCAEAASEGAQLVVFPETFVPVYPSSRWARYMAEWERSEDAKAVFARLARRIARTAERGGRPDRRDRARQRRLARRRCE